MSIRLAPTATIIKSWSIAMNTIKQQLTLVVELDLSAVPEAKRSRSAEVLRESLARIARDAVENSLDAGDSGVEVADCSVKVEDVVAAPSPGQPPIEHALKPGHAYCLPLSNGGMEAGFTARVVTSGDDDLYREVAIDVVDSEGKVVSCTLVGLHPDRLTPQISQTTDALGEGDMNLVIDPTAPAEDAVIECDVRSSWAQRNNRDSQRG